ncbi:MAG: phage holin family protein, partial [Raoultibacter sp.]
MTELLIVTAMAIVFDVVSGVAGAVKTGTLKSGKMREGLWHKCGFVGMIAFAFLLEYAAAHIPEFGIDVPAVSVVCVYVILTETISVIENLCVLNPKIASSPLG